MGHPALLNICTGNLSCARDLRGVERVVRDGGSPAEPGELSTLALKLVSVYDEVPTEWNEQISAHETWRGMRQGAICTLQVVRGWYTTPPALADSRMDEHETCTTYPVRHFKNSYLEPSIITDSCGRARSPAGRRTVSLSVMKRPPNDDTSCW